MDFFEQQFLRKMKELKELKIVEEHREKLVGGIFKEANIKE